MKKWIYILLTAALLSFCACGNNSAQNGGSENSSQQESSSILDDENSSSTSGDSCVESENTIQIKSDFEKQEYFIDNFTCNLSYGYEEGNIDEKVKGAGIETCGGMVFLLDKPREEKLVDISGYVLQALDYKEEYSQTFVVAKIIPIDEFINSYTWEKMDGEYVFQHTEKLTIPRTLLKTEGERTLYIIVINYGIVDGKAGGRANSLCINYEVEGEIVRITDIKY